MQMNRRTFLATATAAGATVLSRGAFAVEGVRPSEKLRQLSYTQVQLLPGPMLTQFQHNQRLYLSLDNDALLKPFRQLTGQPAPGEEMGGWYSPSKDFDPPKTMTGYIPGHSFGQYLSALSRGYAITGDKATQQKIHELIRGFAPTALPSFYNGYCLPWYTYEKTLGGLIDAHQFAHDPMALAVLGKATDAVTPYLPDHALTRAEMKARPHPTVAYEWDESYTLPENLYLAWQRGAGTRYHTLARRFLQDDTFFTPLAHGQNVLPGQHAYSHVNALSSAMQAYLLDGSTMHFEAARNGFRFVQEQSYATGGWGPGETFRKPASDDLAHAIEKEHNTFETPCGAYGHFKIARYLLRVTGDSTYGDSMETVLYNTILGARPTQQDGTTFYYADYSNDAQKVSYEQKWPCCSGTFAQLTADYGVSTFFSTAEGIAVNLYTPSRVSFRQGSARLQVEQSTVYPNDGDVSIAVHADRPARFTLQLRIPSWAGNGTRLLVNGTSQTPSVEPGTWFKINREWRKGDRVELTLDMPLRLTPLDAGHADTVALMAGPLALFALLPAPDRFTRQQLLAAQRVAGTSPQWAVASPSASPVSLVPFTGIDGQHYRLYHRLAGSDSLQAHTRLRGMMHSS